MEYMKYIMRKPLYVIKEQHVSKIRLKVKIHLYQIKNQMDNFRFIKS